MFSGVALALSGIPKVAMDLHGLGRRVHSRGGEPEVQFLLRDCERVLPVWLDGEFQVVRWGNRRGQSPGLPCTAWTSLETMESGGWVRHEPREVLIPASLGLDRGVWYSVREGVRGVVVRDEEGSPVAYVLVEPSTHYYQVMTRSEWMPSLVRELI